MTPYVKLLIISFLALSPYDKLKKEISDAGNHLVVIEFVTSWCGPCKLMRKNLTNLEKCMPEVVFLQSDIDKDEKSAEEFEIDTLPTFKFVYKTQTIKDTVRGAVFNELKKKTEKHLEKNTSYCDWLIFSMFCLDKVDKCLAKHNKSRSNNEIHLTGNKKSIPYVRPSQKMFKKLDPTIILLKNNSVPDFWPLKLAKIPRSEPAVTLSEVLYKSFKIEVNK